MKKGFTLIEILAVITLLGVLALIIIPATERVIKDSQNDSYEMQINNLKQSLKNYASENVFKLPTLDGDYYDITLGDLKKAGYVEVDFKDPRNNKCISNDTVLRITRTKNNYKYSVEGEVTTSDNCEV